MNESHELRGTLDRFIFQEASNGFSVALMQTEDGTSVTVRGYLSSLKAGNDIVLQGNWTNHPKFGRQFEVSSYTVQLPMDSSGLRKYLASGLIKGIGKTYADKMINQFGTHIIEIIEQQPERLQEVNGIGKKRADQIVEGWHRQKELSSIMIYLHQKGISSAYAIKIYKQYGAQSIAVIEENPYRLAHDVWGIGFKVADTIAQTIGFDQYSVARTKAGILHAISEASNQGHLYIQLDELKKNVKELLTFNETHDAVIKNALHELYQSDAIKLITYQNIHFITLRHLYGTEKNLAEKIKQHCAYQSVFEFNFDDIYKTLSNSQKSLNLTEDQQKAIITCLQSKITIITGGPGTGKTTLIKQLLHILDTNSLQYYLAAPTGRAAKRISESTRKNALTLHRLLEFDPLTKGFSHNEMNALKLDFLIIDEASMIDIFLAYAVIKALPARAHLVLIGDCDQLPSVGSGHVLGDLIESTVIKSIKLTQIFRQAQDSMIITNAHRVNHGEFLTRGSQEKKNDFILIVEENPEQITNHLKTIYHQILPHFGIPYEESIVLTPMNRGIVGTYSLNIFLQNLLNPDNTESIIHTQRTFRKNDKVMQIRNNYEKFVFNGDIGTIATIDTIDQKIIIHFGERAVDYDFEDLDEIVLAYSISIHKSQGSEYDAVIIPLYMHHFMLLQRNLVYTAITRAKKLCIVIGQPKAIAIAIKNNKQTKRITFLQQYLTTDLSCHSSSSYS